MTFQTRNCGIDAKKLDGKEKNGYNSGKVIEMKKRRIRSAIPIYGGAALWLILGLICPRMLLKGWFLLLAAALTAGVYFVLSRLFPGREVEVREAARSGDKAIDALIEEGRGKLDSLRAANAAIPDADISGKLDRMVNAGEEILKLLERDTSKAQVVRRFMNYYLPTADKLMSTYRMMMEAQSGGENIARAMKSVENSLGMIADAFEKQLDNLYKDRTLDIETDIQVLETMMAGDGLTGKNGIREELKKQKGTAQAGR